MGSIFDRIASRPLNNDEKQILSIYNTIAMLIFKDLLSVKALRFLVVLMRVNDIGQSNITISQPAMSIEQFDIRMRENMINLQGGMRL